MRIVVVGCNGFIGNAVVQELNNLGIENIGLSKETFNLLEESTTDKLGKILKKNDHIVFTSAIAPSKSAEDVGRSLKMAEIFCRSVVDLSINQLILISSDSVYGDKSGIFNEKSPRDPNSFHGLAQLAREIVFENSKIMNLAILRPCAVYGEGDTHNGYGPNRFVNQIRKLESINIFGEGLNYRDHIHIKDVVDLIIRCIKTNFVGDLNVVSGKTYSFREVAEKCRLVFDPNSKIEKIGSEGEIFIKNFDNSKLSEIFPDFMAMNLEEGLSLWRNQV